MVGAIGKVGAIGDPQVRPHPRAAPPHTSPARGAVGLRRRPRQPNLRPRGRLDRLAQDRAQSLGSRAVRVAEVDLVVATARPQAVGRDRGG